MKKIPTASLRRKIKTTADLAAHVGLSRATVSRILNGHTGIKQQNIDRVMQVVERTGFSPNPYSNMLRGQRSATIAVCLSSFKRPVVVQKLAELVRSLARHGYTPLVETAENTDHVAIMKWIMRMRAEAAVFVGHHDRDGLASHVRELSEAGIPHVFADDFEDAKANIVTVDRARGMELVGNHLLDLGHRRIGLLGIREERSFELVRLKGLRRALQARRLDPADVLVSLENPPPRTSNMRFGREAAQQFAAMRPRPTAFVTLDDELAFGAIEGFREAGLCVPDDLSVVGFNNEDIAEIASPSITTVDVQVKLSAAAAVDFLHRQLQTGSAAAGRQQLIEPKLIVRRSTGPATN